METFDDTCRCGYICTCGGDDWGEVPDEDSLPGENLTEMAEEAEATGRAWMFGE